MKPHPPKPFTPEWCQLHPGQGQCPDDIPGASIDNIWLIMLLIIAGLTLVYFKIKKYNRV